MQAQSHLPSQQQADSHLHPQREPTREDFATVTLADGIAVPAPTVTLIPSDSAASSLQTTVVPKIAKVTVASGYISGAYERAIESHRLHAEEHGYGWHILREPILEGVWNKLALLMQVTLNELSKPAEERVEWIFWFDADSILLNPHIPLEIFLPPSSHSHINLMIGKDFNGINAGVFFLRVRSATVQLIARIMAYIPMHKDVELIFAEQSALKNLIEEDEDIRKTVQYVPRRWFNAYFTDDEDELRGRLIVHFPAPDMKWRIWKWLERAGYVPNASIPSATLKAPSATETAQFEPSSSDLSSLFSPSSGRYWQPTLPFSPYPSEIHAFWSTLRRASAVLKGLEVSLGGIHDDVRDTGSKTLAAVAREKFEELKKAVSEKGETADLQLAMIEAEQSHERWVGTMHVDDSLPAERPVLPTKSLTANEPYPTTEGQQDDEELGKLRDEFNQRLEDFHRFQEEQKEGLVGGGPTPTEDANASPTSTQTDTSEEQTRSAGTGQTTPAETPQSPSIDGAQMTTTEGAQTTSTETSQTIATETPQVTTTDVAQSAQSSTAIAGAGALGAGALGAEAIGAAA